MKAGVLRRRCPTSLVLACSSGGESAVETVDVDVNDERRLELLVTNALDGASRDRASWGNAGLECGDS